MIVIVVVCTIRSTVYVYIIHARVKMVPTQQLVIEFEQLAFVR